MFNSVFVFKFLFFCKFLANLDFSANDSDEGALAYFCGRVIHFFYYPFLVTNIAPTAYVDSFGFAVACQ